MTLSMAAMQTPHDFENGCPTDSTEHDSEHVHDYKHGHPTAKRNEGMTLGNIIEHDRAGVLLHMVYGMGDYICILEALSSLVVSMSVSVCCL